VEGLRRRLKQLLDDSELRVTMGRNARKLFERNFTLAQTVERTLAIYAEVARAA
jgi:glycosyltransferase involved in cell wall biosynthesis